MAFTWKEKYATIIDSSTWSQSIEGYKITNVFGLAWNYYIAYTKFITGLDITMDVGMKVETFYANCYKLGYASEMKSNTFKSVDMKNSMSRVFESNQLIAAASAKKVAEETALIGKISRTIGTELAAIDTLTVAGGTSTEEWAVSKKIVSPCTILLGADISIEVQSGASNLLVNPQGLFAIGPIIDLG